MPQRIRFGVFKPEAAGVADQSEHQQGGGRRRQAPFRQFPADPVDDFRAGGRGGVQQSRREKTVVRMVVDDQQRPGRGAQVPAVGNRRPFRVRRVQQDPAVGFGQIFRPGQSCPGIITPVLASRRLLKINRGPAAVVVQKSGQRQAGADRVRVRPFVGENQQAAVPFQKIGGGRVINLCFRHSFLPARSAVPVCGRRRPAGRRAGIPEPACS